jgi:hypothetical protein
MSSRLHVRVGNMSTSGQVPTQSPRRALTRLCGRGYATAEEAQQSQAARGPDAVIDDKCPCGEVHVRQQSQDPPRLQGPSRTSRETGFPHRVKLLTRVRAGRGNADNAVCECCGRWLGHYGGEVCKRRVARGLSDITNAVLLCENRHEGCRQKGEDRDPEMEAKGFFIRDGNMSEHDPRYVPVRLWDGSVRWLGTGGSYLSRQPTWSASPAPSASP